MKTKFNLKHHFLPENFISNHNFHYKCNNLILIRKMQFREISKTLELKFIYKATFLFNEKKKKSCKK